MPAYLFLLLAVLSRLALAATPHPEWFNFTAVGGMLLYFGARRSWREMLAPLAVLMALDYFLTVFRLSLRIPLGSLPSYMGLVRSGNGAGADSAAFKDDVCARRRGGAAGAHFILPDVELCGLGRQ
jgi:hypothetical protein